MKVWIVVIVFLGGVVMAKSSEKEALKQYCARRDLTRSPEPQPGTSAKKAKEPLFVVQKHAASHMHYDVRLSIDGVLKSWAVPKGPSLDPTDKRLAIPTDDHPLAYATFEGVIPEGEYGAGTVMVFDSGSYENIKKKHGKLVPMRQCYEDGAIEVFLHGTKLRGGFALVRTHPADHRSARWLMIKIDDAYADPKADLSGPKVKSALTARTMHQITQNVEPVEKKEADMSRTIKVGRYTVPITSEDKILFPRAHISKGELIRYYERIAPYMIPHMKDRPITMRRFVHGIGDEGFYQKDASDYFPAWIARVPVEKQDGGVVDYVACNNAATLVYLANQLTIEQHVWLSRSDKLNYPDRMIFDLDPSSKDFNGVRQAALQLKDLLEGELGLCTFVMTTGSRGLHVVVPLKRIHDFDQVHAFAKDVATLMVKRYPQDVTIEMRKAKRRGKVFVDYLRNSWAQTGIAPYSVRAQEGAPVATPLLWKEVSSTTLTPQKFTIKNMFKRLSSKGDLWKDIDAYACTLKDARKALDKLLK